VALPRRGGKDSPPPPKGKGKGSAANAAPKAKSKPSVPLFGRRLDWQSLSQEKVSGTVFAGFSEEVVGVAEDVTLLKALFEQPKVCSALPNKEATSVKPKCLELLSAKRAQNILIALRRQPLSEQTVGALERLDFEGVGLSPEACQVLMGALPTPEESALLVQHRERASEMRELERTLLPLACLEKPSVTQRLRIVLFARTRVELARDLRSAFRELKGAFKDARASASFRTVLQHTAHLGNVINYGAVKADERVAAGFSLEALPKLYLFKSANDQRITLLHVLVSQILATKPALPEALRGDLADLKAAKRWAADGASVNGVVDMGFTPLFFAATNGRGAVVAWLLEQRADATAQCVGRRTALHWASRNGHMEVVRMLIAAKAPLDVRDRSDRTPLGVAVDKNQAEVVALLKAAGASA